jgi:hypothetical protein
MSFTPCERCNGSGTDHGTPDPAELARMLSRTIAELDGYVQRRAEEFAAPVIEKAAERAGTEITAARAEQRMQAQRDTDLIAELRKRAESRARVIDTLRAEAQRAEDLIVGLRGELARADRQIAELRVLNRSGDLPGGGSGKGNDDD